MLAKVTWFTQLHGKILPIIFLAFIPFLAGVFVYVYGYYLFGNPSTTYPRSNYVTFIILRSAQACYLIVIVYGLYPLVLTAESYNKESYENIVTQFEFTKKILFVGVPILVILVIAARIFTYLKLNDYLLSHFFPLYDFSFAILASSIAAVVGALVRIAVLTSKKEFRFYLARGYCILASKKEANLDKIKYLFLSLDSYNKYLLRKIKFGIKNINKIYSDIIHTDVKNDEMMKSISEHLAGDRLDLAIYLSTLYTLPATEQFFIKEAFVQRFRMSAAFLAAAIPIVISIIQLITKG